VDLLSQLAPNWSPYRYCYDSPVEYTDPYGLFESRKEARAYRKANGITGRIQKNNEGTYDINDYENHISYSTGNDKGISFDKHRNDGVVESILVTNNNSSFGGKDLYDALGIGQGYFENYGYNSISTASKSKFVWESRKLLNTRLGINIVKSNSEIYRNAIPKGIKGVGLGMWIVSGGLVVTDVVINKSIKASNILDATITGLSFIPGCGWAIGGLYLGADLLTKAISGKSIGQHLDEAVEENFDFDKGELVKF
jgi:hypothetical protein